MTGRARTSPRRAAACPAGPSASSSPLSSCSCPGPVSVHPHPPAAVACALPPASAFFAFRCCCTGADVAIIPFACMYGFARHRSLSATHDPHLPPSSLPPPAVYWMVKTHKRKRKEAIAKQQAMEAAARARAQSRIIKPKVRASWGWVFVCVRCWGYWFAGLVMVGTCVCVRERGVEGLRRPIHYLAAAPLAGQPPMLLSTPHYSLLECRSLLRSPSPSAPAPTTSWSAPAAWRPACPTAPRSSARWVRCACFGP